MRKFKLAERVAQERFEISSTITAELYDTKPNYRLIVSIIKWKCQISLLKTSGIYFSSFAEPI